MAVAAEALRYCSVGGVECVFCSCIQCFTDFLFFFSVLIGFYTTEHFVL